MNTRAASYNCTTKQAGCVAQLCIKTHSSVPCGPSSWHTTLVTILTELRPASTKPGNFRCGDALNRQYPTFKNHTRCFRDMNFQKLV